MKPWSAIVYDDIAEARLYGRGNGATGVVYACRRQQEAFWNADGMQDKNIKVYFFDEEITCDAFIENFAQTFPGVTIIKAKSQRVLYRDYGPQRSGRFTDAGLLPE